MSLAVCLCRLHSTPPNFLLALLAMSSATNIHLSGVALNTIVLTYVFLFLALIVAVDHVYFRRIIKNSFRWDDMITLCAFILSLALVGQITWAVIDGGQGQHVSNVTKGHFGIMAKVCWSFAMIRNCKTDFWLTYRVRAQSLLANEVLWSLENTLMRISALLFLLRLFRFSAAYVILQGTILLTTMHGIAAIFVAVFICRPIQASYLDVPGSCGNQMVAFVSLEIGGLLLDIAITGIPCQQILNFSGRKRDHVNNLVVFSAGGL